MADETPAGTAAPQPATQATAPTVNIVGQYIKDLSFENPGAPQSIMGGVGQPGFNVAINVGVKKQSDDLYAVELTINAKAEREKTILFQAELIYGGLFRLKNWPEAQIGPMLMIECPRLIFPFARQVLASVTQQGGFPPVLLDPVDFTSIYRQNLAQIQAAQAKAAAERGATAATGLSPEIILTGVNDKKPN